MLTIVTGASQNHSKSLKQFLDTLKIVQVEYQCYIYDLGLEEEYFNSLKELYPTFIYRKFDYSKYPDYFNININAGEYAWKPVIIEEVSKEVDGILIWSDAGNKVLDSFQILCNIIESQGIYSSISCDTIKDWTHPLTLKYFNIQDPNFLWLMCRNAALIGFDTKKPEVMNFIENFSKLAQDKDCIAPTGSDRSNHRQDQAILTILYYQFFKGVHTEYRKISYSNHNDID